MQIEDMHLGARPELFKYARELRQNQTDAEKKLWKFLRGGKLKGYKFRRQHPILHFIADFYCHEKRLVVELDGKYHQYKLQADDDAERTEMLRKLGVRVIRFRNEDVLGNIRTVVKKIEQVLEE